MLDRVAPKSNRSRLISQGVLEYVKNQSAANLRERLKQGALANAQLDLELAKEWFPSEQAPWQRLEPEEQGTKPIQSGGNLPGLDVVSTAWLDQICTVDQQLLIHHLGLVDDATMFKVDEAPVISLGLIRL